MQGLLNDNRVTVVFGAVVAVGAALYVAFGPSAETPYRQKAGGGSKKRKKKANNGFDGPRGLHNSGNTCFVNAILQAAAACPALIQWLEELGYRHQETSETTQEKKVRLLKDSFIVP